MTVNSILGSTYQMPARLELPADGQDGSAIPTVQPTPSSGSANLVSRNFAAADSGGSRYVESTLSGLRLDSAYGTRMNAILGALMSQTAIWDAQTSSGRDNTYINGTRLGIAAERSVRHLQHEDTVAGSQRNLDEIKDGIEEKARQATAPTDVDGQTIDVPGSGSTDVPMPEISGSGSSVPPPVSGSKGQASAPQAAALTPRGPSVTAPAASSLDVVV